MFANFLNFKPPKKLYFLNYYCSVYLSLFTLETKRTLKCFGALFLLNFFSFFKDMAPFYEEVCKDLSWPVDNTLLETMQKANEEQLKKLDDAIEDAEKNLGEMEVRESFLNKAEYLSKIGSKVSD